jgi:hypothetical protein
VRFSERLLVLSLPVAVFAGCGDDDPDRAPTGDLVLADRANEGGWVTGSARARRVIVWMYLIAVVTLTGLSTVTVFVVPIWMTILSILLEIGLFALAIPLQRALGVTVLRDP